MSTAVIQDAEVVDGSEEVTQALAVVPTPPVALAVTPTVKASELVARLDVIREAMNHAMKRDVDYGVIPGTDKPALLKPGAEKLGVLFQLDVQLVNEKVWGPGDHLTVMSHATVFHAPTGARLGYGEGLCSTRERKYAYRKQERACPTCGKAAVIKGKAEYGGGWLCWKKRDGCGATFPDGSQEIESQPVGEIDNPDLPDLYNCVTPETRILTRDLRWVSAGDLATGDILISVAEENVNQYKRPYEDAVVAVGERFTDEVYELKTDDGRIVRCNGEHRWLVKGVNGGAEWVSTETIHEALTGKGTGRPRAWRILSTGTGTPWTHDTSLEAGYLAGLLDADGSLDVDRTSAYQMVGVSFAQQHGGVLDRYIAGLESRDFDVAQYAHLNRRLRRPVVLARLRGGLFEQMRLLGTLRPPRLLDRWADLVDLSRRRFEGGTASVQSIERIGNGELVRLGTSSHTYIAEGLVCHNTIVKMASKRARVDAVLAVTGASALFTQDVDEQQPSSEPTEPAPSLRPLGEEYDPAMKKLIGGACTQLCDGDPEQGRALFDKVKASCGGYLPQGAALALVDAAEAVHRLAHPESTVEAPEL